MDAYVRPIAAQKHLLAFILISHCSCRTISSYETYLPRLSSVPYTEDTARPTAASPSPLSSSTSFASGRANCEPHFGSFNDAGCLLYVQQSARDVMRTGDSCHFIPDSHVALPTAHRQRPLSPSADEPRALFRYSRLQGIVQETSIRVYL